MFLQDSTCSKLGGAPEGWDCNVAPSRHEVQLEEAELRSDLAFSTFLNSSNVFQSHPALQHREGPSRKAPHSDSFLYLELQGFPLRVFLAHRFYRMHVSFTTSARTLTHLGTLCLLLHFKASATCYYPNGTADNTHTFLPCKSSGQSMCCSTNTTGTALSPDTCNSDGLCIPPDNNGVWRKLCTDKTWKDPACIGLCINGKGEIFKICCVVLTGVDSCFLC